MRNWSKFEKLLVMLFLLTVPAVRPWIHADGRFYYAWARTVLFQHNFDFAQDWYHCLENNPSIPDPATAYHAMFMPQSGHYWNKWTIGPAILWSPFLLTARGVTMVLDKFRGTHLADDGFSKPYMIAMAAGTLLYGFLALWLSLRFARRYVPEQWAFLATVGIWMATPFTFYLYVDPSYSHVHSAFLVALLIWLWDHTRAQRSWWQWLELGAVAGLMLDTYYPNAFLLILPLVDAFSGYWHAFRERVRERWQPLLIGNILFAVSAAVVFLPTLLVKKVVFGSYFQSGYHEHWYWNSPAFFRVWFSSHGLFSWTPILIPAVLCLFFLRRINRTLSYTLLGVFLAFTYFIGCYEGWHAIPSFGSRFFVSFTIVFILGLGVFLKGMDGWLGQHHLSWPVLGSVTSLLILWNYGVIYQWAAHLFSQFGEVSWAQIIRNQFTVVPGQVLHLLHATILQRFGWK